MSKRVDTSFEYAVEVPGRGYIGWVGILKPDIETGLSELAEAEKILKSWQQEYISMGCPEIAETLRLVSRVVTVTRSNWAVEWDVATQVQP